MDPPLEQRLEDTLKIADSLDSTKWEERFCVLDMDQRRLYFFSDSENVHLVPQSPSRPYSQDDSAVPLRAETEGETDSNPFKRGASLGRVSSFNKLRTSFRNKKGKEKEKEGRVERPDKNAKSLKVERVRSIGKAENDKVPNSLSQQRRLGQSLDSLDKLDDACPAALGEPETWLDMATRGTLCIQEVHPSISPKHSCLRILARQQTLYASCGSTEDLQKWLRHLHACRAPQKDLYNRVDTRLVISLQEARNVPSKKWYFCEVLLNGVLYSQTCCKQKGDILFWGEQFVFSNLPAISQITVKLFKESQTKKKKDKSTVTELGIIELPMHQLAGGGEMEKWHNMVVHQVAQGKGLISTRDSPAVRIKASYQSVSVLPLKAYSEFQSYLTKEYSHLVSVLEPSVSARWKDEIAQTLLRILLVTGEAKDFLVDVVMSEVSRMENENLVFRGNTFATKAVDTYMKMVGEKYLRSTLGGLVIGILESEADFEVDPTKLPSGASLEANQKQLEKLVWDTWRAITASHEQFPSELRHTFCAIRQKFGKEKEDVCFRLISGSIFLRFFCPAILSPSLFHLCQEYPDERTNRKLTLVAKVVQSLANFTRFGVKEEYMYFMNNFVENHIPNMKRFLDRISSPLPGHRPYIPWNPHNVDQGRELSIMHTILTDQLKKLGPAVSGKLPRLVQVLDNVKKTVEESGRDLIDDALQTLSSTIRQLDAEGYGTDRSPSPSDSTVTPSDPPPLWGDLIGRRSSQHQLGSFSSLTSAASTPSGTPAGTPVKFASHTFSTRHLTSEQRERPQIPRSSVPNLSESSSSEVVPPWKMQRQKGFHTHSVSMDLSPKGPDDFDVSTMDVEQLRKELLEEKKKRKHYESEVQVLKKELNRTEESKKQLEFDLATLSRSKGEKVSKVMNMLKRAEGEYKEEKETSEKEVERLKREMEQLKQQLKKKDETVQQQERRISSLVVANTTLTQGLEQLQKLNDEASDSDSEEDTTSQQQQQQMRPPFRADGGFHGQPNGSAIRNASREPVTPTTKEFMKVISKLDKGQFDFTS